MKITQAEQFGMLLQQLQALTDTVKTEMTDLFANPDSALPGELHEYFGVSHSVKADQVCKELAKVGKLLHDFSAIHYYLVREKTIGKGEWRELADRDSHMRVSFSAITELRRHGELDLITAKVLVEAYQDRLIK
jgi:hypothetical protein